MACHAAAHGEDTLGDSHAAQVFRRSLDTHEHDFMFPLCPLLSLFGGEYDLAGGSAGRGGETLGHGLGALEGGLVEDGV